MGGHAASRSLPYPKPLNPEPRGRRRREDPASAAMLASLLAASPCALTVADAAAPDQPALFVNAVWQRRTGYGAAEVLGRNLRFLQAPPGAPWVSGGHQGS